MGVSDELKGTIMVLLASLVLALTVSFQKNVLILYAFISFLAILCINIVVKKWVGYALETRVKTRFWSWYQFGWRKDKHFKTPIPMAWLPLLLALFTKGVVWWLGILEFDVEAKTERVSRRHGLYRFTQVTEWHMALIAMWAVLANVLFGVIGYVVGFELFAKLSIYYAAWSLVPLSSLDGSKILFGSKYLWITLAVIIALFAAWAVVIPI